MKVVEFFRYWWKCNHEPTGLYLVVAVLIFPLFIVLFLCSYILERKGSVNI